MKTMIASTRYGQFGLHSMTKCWRLNSAGHFSTRREGNARKRHCVQCKKDGRKTATGQGKQFTSAHSVALHCVKSLVFLATILCETSISWILFLLQSLE